MKQSGRAGSGVTSWLGELGGGQAAYSSVRKAHLGGGRWRELHCRWATFEWPRRDFNKTREQSAQLSDDEMGTTPARVRQDE